MKRKFTMQINKLNNHGFAHYAALIIAVVVAITGGTFITVVRVHHNLDAKSNLAKTSASSESKLPSSQKSQPKLSAVKATESTPTTSTATPSSPTPAAKTSAPSSSKSTTANSTQPAVAPSSTPSQTTTPAPTPLSSLTAIITALNNGSAAAQVTASNVAVPGPISTAQARPIVFTVNGQIYFAYRQGQAPDFSTTATQTAESMAIVNATVNGPALTSAVLDKTNKLVAPDYHYVGYSTGGN